MGTREARGFLSKRAALIEFHHRDFTHQAVTLKSSLSLMAGRAGESAT
jgi:hypothetical protein